MIWAALAVIVGLMLLVWSADRFVEGASATAQHFGMSPLLIGMVIVGFGTSAPEMVVSVLAAMQGNPGIALGNAYGSNITNIALILGITALISPIVVQPQIIRREMPVLLAVTALAIGLLWDGMLSFADGVILMTTLVLLMGWTMLRNMKGRDNIVRDIADEFATPESRMSLRRALFWLVLGLGVLILSSRLLVWGAVTIAQALGVSDLIIGLTVVAIGTSLPELASSVIAARKGEHDIALGNIIGSNLFNTLAVVGLAAAISPMEVAAEVLNRDVLVMTTLTVLLLVFAWSGRRINRLQGGVFLAAYAAYTVYLVGTAF
ncbi:MAG: calcium/sodium antiporter [Neisseria sp.]|nr:calcium/sodium antiporter [Neisseria sp.]